MCLVGVLREPESLPSSHLSPFLWPHQFHPGPPKPYAHDREDYKCGKQKDKEGLNRFITVGGIKAFHCHIKPQYNRYNDDKREQSAGYMALGIRNGGR